MSRSRAPTAASRRKTRLRAFKFAVDGLEVITVTRHSLGGWGRHTYVTSTGG